jgi:putative transposase
VLDGEGGTEPRVVITDKLASYPPAIRRTLPNSEHRRHKGLSNRAENSHLPTRKRERILQRFKSAEHAQRPTLPGLVQRRLQPLPPSSTPAERLHLQTFRTQAHAAWQNVTRAGVRHCDTAFRRIRAS